MNYSINVFPKSRTDMTDRSSVRKNHNSDKRQDGDGAKASSVQITDKKEQNSRPERTVRNK